MTPRKPPITSLRVKHFKAVKDSGLLRPGPLTVFIGNNGTGKSSVLEALRFAATLAHATLDDALAPSKGYEHLRWKGAPNRGHPVQDSDLRGGSEATASSKTKEEPPRARRVAGGELREYNPVEITVAGHVGRAKARALTRISGQNRNLVVFEKEELKVGADVFSRDPRTPPNRSIFQRTAWFDDWQFLDLEPARMGLPASRTRSDAAIRLLHTGDNLAEYLRGLREVPGEGALAFEGLVDALRVILPYARDLDVDQREGFERETALRLTEGSFTVPGWMLSTGTLRLVALLALLRHPRPPSLLCVEEIENGLDPRTVHLVVRELLRAADSGRTQIMVTTHSPYLLDLVPLESLVLVARDGGEPPRFDRPNDHEEVREWAKRFTLGNLYTMGTLHQRRDR